jgi:hypothetical protein
MKALGKMGIAVHAMLLQNKDMGNTTTATSTKAELWRETIRNTLALQAGDAPDASAVAEATTNAWRQVTVLLTPVIGARGVDVIFRRSLYLTSKSFPWLAFGEEHGGSAVLLVNLKARMSNRDAEIAIEASCALVATFIELLTTLIGESLTERLVRPVWAFPSPPSEPETE